MEKTLLLLGGSSQQVVAIETANRLGCRTVLCDYLEDNPGQYVADKFYLVSTTDKEAVLAVAKKEHIDGVVAYASDPAAPTASYVAERLGLPGMPYQSAATLCQKDLFRKFLSDNGFNVPQVRKIEKGDTPSNEELISFKYPVVVKPTDSSGSKGVSVVYRPEDVSRALEYAAEISRNDILIVEEFIERNHPHVIEAELTISEGEVLTWGLINSIRDEASNPLLPAAYSYPLEIPEHAFEKVKCEITSLIHKSGMKAGAFNIEMIIDADDDLYFLDAGPRNGGNMLPDFISMIAHGDIIETTIRIALGANLPKQLNASLDGKSGGAWGLAVFHSKEEGIFEEIAYSELAEKCLVKEYLFANRGDTVEAFSRSDKAFGFAFFEFASNSEKQEVMNNLERHVWAILS